MSGSKLFRSALVGVALVVSAASVHAASYGIYNDQGGWLDSVQAMGVTTYGTGTFACGEVGKPSGASCDVAALNGLPGVSFAQNGNGSASHDGGLLNNLNGGYLEWSFTTPQNGWGGTFEMSDDGNAGLTFEANDLNLGWIDVYEILANQGLNGFFGFTSADRFLGVRVSALPPVGEGPVGTSYKMTDVSIARAEVPEPGTLALLGLGLAGLGFTRRRKA